MTTTTATPDRQAEIDAIKHVVAVLEHAQRNELVDEFVSLFREDAIWTTGAGRLLVGRDAIAEFTKQVLPGAMKGLVPSYEVVHVLFIRPDVAAVKVRQRYFSPEGELVTEEGEGTPMYVMSKEDGQWRLTANQNTHVAAGA
ncbi:SgcJ/EcaC family oxidoreductase [Micromonospora sp. HM5-17]|uniref:SgcJ/EcaC family oxidoreductase n=1 Tax=Micromonospora sp. HM5-17 TaxID=2487710 RepID=UPI000F4ADB6D|nr:SgcJ/EcaC family oxidoreductase [Micromonospora sp. HM5-17]ROT31905.1 SgcJ/EcaC family oxidoreductase [Micromonospora sp. HM5-17]